MTLFAQASNDMAVWGPTGAMVVNGLFSIAIAWYLITKALPKMQEDNRNAQTTQQGTFSADLKSQREDFQVALARERDDFKNTLAREREDARAMLSMVIDSKFGPIPKIAEQTEKLMAEISINRRIMEELLALMKRSVEELAILSRKEAGKRGAT